MPKGVYKHYSHQALNLMKNGESVNKGKKYSKDHRKKIGLAKMGNKNPMYGNGKAREGEKNPHWKGDDIKYSGLHKWVYKELGSPDICENCGANGLSNREIYWANKDHTYKRNLNDWMRLCNPCHRIYDKGRMIVYG